MRIHALSWYVGKSCLMGFASCKTTESALEEMRKYVERKLEDTLRIMREKSESISGVILKLDGEDIF